MYLSLIWHILGILVFFFLWSKIICRGGRFLWEQQAWSFTRITGEWRLWRSFWTSLHLINETPVISIAEEDSWGESASHPIWNSHLCSNHKQTCWQWWQGEIPRTSKINSFFFFLNLERSESLVSIGFRVMKSWEVMKSAATINLQTFLSRNFSSWEVPK